MAVISLATRLIGQLHQAGYKARLSDLFNHPGWLILPPRCVKPTSLLNNPLSTPEERYRPFALTDVQQAYLVGRQPGFALGVGYTSLLNLKLPIGYSPAGEGLEPVNRRHDMLRAVVRDGQQRVLEQTSPWVIPAHILHSPEEALQVRDRLAHQVLNPEVWPVFDLPGRVRRRMPAACGCVWITLLLTG